MSERGFLSETRLASQVAHQFKDNIYLRHYEVSDLAQECLTRLAQEKKRQRKKYFPQSYLKRLFRNHLLNLIKSEKTQKRGGERVTIPLEELIGEPAVPVVPTEVISKEQVDRAIRQLPKDLQKIYRLIYVEDISYKDTAQKLNIHRATLDRKLKQLHQTLRKKLQAV